MESAVEEKLRNTKRAPLYAAYEEAAKDDEFLAGMASATRNFVAAEADGL